MMSIPQVANGMGDRKEEGIVGGCLGTLAKS